MKVHDLGRRLVHRHAESVVGDDGLTEQERLADLVAYRSGVGQRPEMTAELRMELGVLSEKLFGTTHTVRRPAR